ncbi:Solute carrier 26 [Rhizoclosmatium sp. JEL0117]|nr:Solute carrier 26 [Rhizoclosmatium sp. JEL0117]
MSERQPLLIPHQPSSRPNSRPGSPASRGSSRPGSAERRSSPRPNAIAIDGGDSGRHQTRPRTQSQTQTQTQWLWTRLRYYVPVLAWLPEYKLKQLPRDALAGATVACLLVPQSLSYAQAILGIPPVYGLYTCFMPLLVYSLLGTSRQLGVGPEALVTILTAAIIRDKPSNSVEYSSVDDEMMENIAIANLLALMVGVFTFLLGFFRLGFLDSVLSRALLRGFVTAVAVVIMIDQSAVLLGLTSSRLSPPPNNETFFAGYNVMRTVAPVERSPIETLLYLIDNLGKSHIPTALVSVSSILFLISMKKLKAMFNSSSVIQFVPEILILVVFSTICSAAFRWDLLEIDVMKDVEGGFRWPQWPTVTFASVRHYVLSAILISVIGFVESIAVAKTYATKYNYAVSPNRELVALGVTNIFGSLFGAWPAIGSLGRSAVNDAAGGKSQVSGFITSLIILFTMLFLLPFFYFLPKAICSSIIVVAASKLIELHDIQFILQVQAWNDLGLLLMTFLTTLLVSIEVGTLISVGVSLLLVVKHTTKTRIAILGRTFIQDSQTGLIKAKYRSINEKVSDNGAAIERVDGFLILRMEEGLFFGNSGQLKDRLKRIEMFGDLSVHPGETPTRRSHGRDLSQVRSVESSRSRSWEPSRHRERSRSVGLSSTSVHPLEETEELFDELLEANGVSAFGNSGPDLIGVIFDVGAVTAIDASATQTLLEVVESYQSRSIQVCFVKLRDSCKPWFVRSGLYESVTPARFFDKINDAVECLSLDTTQDGLNNQSIVSQALSRPMYRPNDPQSISTSLPRAPPPIRFVGMDPDYNEGYSGSQITAPSVIGSWGEDGRGVFTAQNVRAPFVSRFGDTFHSVYNVDSGSGGIQQQGEFRPTTLVPNNSKLFASGSENDLDYGSDNVWD